MCKEVYNIIRRIFAYFQKTIFKESFSLEDNTRVKGLEAHYRKKRILRIAAAVSALISAVLFGMALIRDFVPQNQLFTHGSYLFGIAAAFTALTCLTVFILCLTVIPKEDTAEPIFPKGNEHKAYYSADEIETKIVRALTALGLIAFTAVRISLIVSGKLGNSASLLLTIMATFLAVPFAFYFIPEVTDRLFASHNAHLVSGCFGVAWFLCLVVEKYFDYGYVLSSPYRLTEQLLLLTLMLFTVYEIKMHTSTRAPRLHLALLCVSLIFCFGFTAARCAMLMCEKTVSVENTAVILFEFFFSLYISIRAYHYNED